MNYIEQIKGFWLAQEVNQLGTSEIALYFYLLEICNKTGWTGTFHRNNSKVMADLSIKSYKTFQSVRDRLKSAGIINYNQRNGDANVKYSMSDLSKFYQGSGKGSVEGGSQVGKKYQGLGKGLGKGSVEGLGKGSGKGSVEDNININENINENINNSKSHSGEAPDKEKKLYWKKFVDTWNEFYLQHKSEPYQYLKKDFAALEKIYDFLKKRCEKKGYDWTEQNLINAFNFFLKKAHDKDEWLRMNLSIPNILSQFNQIVNAKTDAAKQATGGSVSTGSILSKIAAMPD